MLSPMDIDSMDQKPEVELACANEFPLEKEISEPSRIFSSPLNEPICCHRNSNETPVINESNNTQCLFSKRREFDIAELDRIHRERREKKGFHNTLHINVPCMEDMEHAGSEVKPPYKSIRREGIARNNGRPRLRIRPKTLLPTVKTGKRVIITSKATENCEDLADQFPSPHSDRFVLQNPSCAEGIPDDNDTCVEDDNKVMENIENKLDEINLEQDSKNASDVQIQTETQCGNISDKEDFLYDSTAVPSPISTCGSDSPGQGGRSNSASIAAKKKLILKPKPPVDYQQQHQCNSDKEDAITGSHLPLSSCSTLNRDKQHDTNSLQRKISAPPDFFESDKPSNWLFDNEFDDDDAVALETFSLKPSLHNTTIPSLPVESRVPHVHSGCTRALKPKRPRIPSIHADLHFHQQQHQETKDDEDEDTLMALAPNLTFSCESHENVADYNFPGSSPARRQIHDEGSIEMAREAAARFGVFIRRRSISSGSIAAVDTTMSPSNMSESNFRTPKQKSIPTARHWWHMRGNSSSNGNGYSTHLPCSNGGDCTEKQGSVGLFLPSLFSNNSEDNISDNELSVGGGLNSSLSFLLSSSEKFSLQRS